MIVDQPPYDLIVLFADLEMQKLIEALLERGQEPRRRCVHSLRWRSLRDPRRDTVWREPDRALRPFLTSGAHILVMWDHQGSGVEQRTPSEIEEEVVKKLTLAGATRDKVRAVAIEPELETLFVPVWGRVKKIVAAERRAEPPSDRIIFQKAKIPRKPEDIAEGLRQFPKEMFEALIFLTRLRRNAPLYRKIGEEISLPAIKHGAAVSRIVDVMRSWFPWGGV